MDKCPLCMFNKGKDERTPFILNYAPAWSLLCRYRQRKRAELDSLEEELHGLEGRNRELRDKAESVEREIQYVKDLLIEVYKARSQRHKQDATA